MASAHPSYSKLAVAVVALLIVYWLGLFVGTHLPIRPRPAVQRHSLDKAQHLIAFSGLAVLLCAAGAVRRVSNRWLLAGVLTIIAIYGLIDESTQALVPNREPDLRDWLADMVGASLGAGSFVIGRTAILGRVPRPSAAPISSPVQPLRAATAEQRGIAET